MTEQLMLSLLTKFPLLSFAECMGGNAVSLKNYPKYLLVAATTIYVCHTFMLVLIR